MSEIPIAATLELTKKHAKCATYILFDHAHLEDNKDGYIVTVMLELCITGVSVSKVHVF